MSMLTIIYGRLGPIVINPPPVFAAYSDVSDSISEPAGISNWGPFTQATTGSRFHTELDSVRGSKLIRSDTGKTMSCSGADFLSQIGGTIYLVVRQRILLAGGVYTLFDSTNGGTTRGVQLRVEDPGGSYRILRFRVFDGTSWIIDHTGEAGAGYVALKRCVIAVAYSSAGVTLSVDNAQPYYSDAFSVTMPTGTSGPFTIGNFVGDYDAVECFAEVHDRAAVVANTVRLGARFPGADLVWTIAYDGVRNFSFPSLCKRNDGRYLAIYRDGLGHATDDGVCVMAESVDMKSWTNYRTIADLTASSGNGLHDPNICAKPFLDGSIYVNWFDDAPTGHLNVIRFIKSADGGATWSAPARITNGGGLNLEVASAPIVEAYGKKYLPVYNGTDESGTTPWNAELYITSNDFATVTTVRIGTGTQVGSPGFSEVDVLDLGGGNMFALLRSELDMYEATSSDQGATWTTPVETNVGAHSAGRIYQDPVTLDIYYLGRHNTILRTFLYWRNHLTGLWSTAPQAPGANASQGTCIYGAMVPGSSTSRVAFVSGSQIGAVVSDTHAAIYAQEWDTSVIRGTIPMVVPSIPAGDPNTTYQLTGIRGAGDYTYAVHANNSNGSINSTGLYTRGPTGGVTDTIRVTDVNGDFTDVSAAVNSAGSSLPDAANIVFDFDASLTASVSPTSGSVDSVANQTGAASSATSNAANKPVYGTSTQNSLKTLDFTGGAILNTTLPGSAVVAFSEFTFAAAFKTGPSVAGAQAFGGTGTGGLVLRIDGGIPKVVDYAGGTIVHSFSDLAVTANTAHVIVFRRTGTTIDCFLDGVKSADPGTISTVEFPVGWPIGNDDAAALVGEQLLAYIGRSAMWKASESDANVAALSATLKAEWATA